MKQLMDRNVSVMADAVIKQGGDVLILIWDEILAMFLIERFGSSGQAAKVASDATQDGVRGSVLGHGAPRS